MSLRPFVPGAGSRCGVRDVRGVKRPSRSRSFSHRHPIVRTWDWSILATDVDDQALDEARLGRYSGKAMAGVPADILASTFVDRGDRYEVDPKLLKRIDYRRLNLVERDAVLAAGPFDLVFLRNVLIYFRPELQRRVVETVEQAMAADGVLFLGPSESLLSLDAVLRPRDLGSCFCYQWPPPVAGLATGTRAARTDHRDATRRFTRNRPVGRTRPAIPTPGWITTRLTNGSGDCWMHWRKADFEGARGIALTLRHEFPENPVIHALVGFAASRVMDFGAAILAYRGALYLDPGSPEIRFLLAVALEADGRSDRALAGIPIGADRFRFLTGRPIADLQIHRPSRKRSAGSHLSQKNIRN